MAPAPSGASLVGDRVADLSNDVSYQFRSGMRTISRVMDELVEGIKSGKEWDDMVRQMQAQVADEVTRVFVGIEEGRGDPRRSRDLARRRTPVAADAARPTRRRGRCR